MRNSIKAMSVAALLASGMVGCTSYYQVTDPITGKVYYTTQVKKDDGATTLHDAGSGRDITIQNSEVMKISKEQFQAANKK